MAMPHRAAEMGGLCCNFDSDSEFAQRKHRPNSQPIAIFVCICKLCID